MNLIKCHQLRSDDYLAGFDSVNPMKNKVSFDYLVPPPSPPPSPPSSPPPPSQHRLYQTVDFQQGVHDAYTIFALIEYSIQKQFNEHLARMEMGPCRECNTVHNATDLRNHYDIIFRCNILKDVMKAKPKTVSVSRGWLEPSNVWTSSLNKGEPIKRQEHVPMDIARFGKLIIWNSDYGFYQFHIESLQKHATERKKILKQFQEHIHSSKIPGCVTMQRETLDILSPVVDDPSTDVFCSVCWKELSVSISHKTFNSNTMRFVDLEDEEVNMESESYDSGCFLLQDAMFVPNTVEKLVCHISCQPSKKTQQPNTANMETHPPNKRLKQM